MIFEAAPTTLVSAHEDGKVCRFLKTSNTQLYFFRLKKTTTEEISNTAQKKATTVSTYKLDAQGSFLIDVLMSIQNQ